MQKKEKESKKETPKKKKSPEKKQPKISGGCMGNKSPGPGKYLLPTLTGYRKHDITKYRNPAFSFRKRQTSQPPCTSPGPKYNLNPEKKKPPTSFTIGYRATSMGGTCTPGPYKLAEFPPFPEFTINGRTNPRSGGGTPGPYKLPDLVGKKVPDKATAPFFTIGKRPCGMRCDAGPGSAGELKLDQIKPKAPRFTIGIRQTGTTTSCGPGPKYMWEDRCYKCAPKAYFGIKHSDCAPPLITECDKKC